MLRRPQHPLHTPVLHRPTRIHHQHVISHLRHHTQVMRDQNDRRPELRLQIRKQVQDLRLHRHIQRRRRLIGDQQIRVVHQRHRDHRPLPHPTRELVRKLIEPLRRLRNPHPAQHVHRPRPGLPPPGPRMMHPVRLRDLPTHRVVRMQRRQRILKDHRHVPTPQPTDLLLTQTHQLTTTDRDLPRNGRPLHVVQTQDRQRRHALTGTGLPHDPQRATTLHRERHPVHGLDDTVLGVEPHPQILDPQVRAFAATRRRKLHHVRLLLLSPAGPVGRSPRTARRRRCWRPR